MKYKNHGYQLGTYVNSSTKISTGLLKITFNN